MVGEIEAVWSLIGRLAAVIGVIVALIKGFEYLMSLMPMSKLEKRIANCEEHNKNDFERLKNIDARVGALERDIGELNQGIQQIGKSQISLLRHFVTGNGQKDMEKEAKDLTDFFIDHNGR